MRKFLLKIVLPTFLSIALFFLTIFLIILPRFQESIMNGKREMIRELTHAAWSILAKYETDEREGILSREEAQKTAVSRIQYLRYGEEGKDYFWITDLHPVMIIHPFRNDLNGKDLSQFIDPHGKRMFVEFVKAVKNNGQGYVDYMWQWKDDSTHIVPKLSYVKGFEPWGWIIGTGIYIEDVKKEIQALTRRLTYISVGITILVALLLIYLAKQSLDAERKRMAAENRLRESNEKYRTLVEATTEGLMMVIEGRISFANAMVCQMTGYEPDSLAGLPLELLLEKTSSREKLAAISGSGLPEGQLELHFRHKNGSPLNVLVTATKAPFYGKEVSILILKDLGKEAHPPLSSSDFQNILRPLGIGYFRAKADGKGRFLHASETAIRLLGFQSFEELQTIPILNLLSEGQDRISLRNELTERKIIRNKTLKIQKKSGEKAYVAISLVMSGEMDGDALTYDGIVEDVTLTETLKQNTGFEIARLRSGGLLLEAPVESVAGPALRVMPDTPVTRVAAIFAEKNPGCILVGETGKAETGVITGRDIRDRVISLQIKPDNPAYLIMSAPVLSVREGTSIQEALTLCRKQNIQHLVIRDHNQIATGIFPVKKVLQILSKAFDPYAGELQYMSDANEIRQLQQRLYASLNPLIRSGLEAGFVTRITSSFADAVVSRLIELATQELGPPPVPFAFITLGSEGRQEESLLTDQDNALVYENPGRENEKNVARYFLKLGEKVCDNLNRSGYTYCKGNIMAKNPMWCQPVSQWKKTFAEWISTPEAKNLLEASIFFDLRLSFGEISLVQSLRQWIHETMKAHPVFLYQMAQNAYGTKTPHLPGSGIITDRSHEMFDLKQALAPLIMLTRTYALKFEVSETHTVKRLATLKEMKVLSPAVANEMLFTYNFLMKYRLTTQSEAFSQGKPITNLLAVRSLNDLEFALLKKILSAIPDFQEKIKTDFRLNT